MGPLIAAFLFLSFGNHWTVGEMTPVLYLGLACQLPMIALYCMVSDDDSVRARRRRARAERRAAREPLPTATATKREGNDALEGADAALLPGDGSDEEQLGDESEGDSAVSEDSDSSSSSSEGGDGILTSASSCGGLVTAWSVPYIIFTGDFLIQLGSGATETPPSNLDTPF